MQASTKSKVRINPRLHQEIIKAIEEIGGWGSLEIFVQDHRVTQITKRVIRKVKHSLKSS
ncbi:DUF2292 domain-containing protein [Patescibacteria group bacterium]